MTLTDVLKKYPFSKFKRPIHEPNIWYFIYTNGVIVQMNSAMQTITPACFTSQSLLSSDWFISEENPPQEILPDNVVPINKRKSVVKLIPVG